MFTTQLPFVELYDSLLEHGDEDAYADVLEQWTENNSAELAWLSDFSQRTKHDWYAATDEDLCRLYAIFRVTSTLLLRFQTGSFDGTNYPGPNVTIEGFRLFHEQLGFKVFEPAEFHPFYHEIVNIQPADDGDSPIEIVSTIWPCLMLDDLLFSRAGCTVKAGSSQIVKDVAERSTLYWTYWRKDRPCKDLSHGWGHNSQWTTFHRRDYRSGDHYHFNVDGPDSLNAPDCVVDELPLNVMIELVKNRCLTNAQIDDDSDLWPYDYCYTEAAL